MGASGADHVKQNNANARTICQEKLFNLNLKLGYFYVDGILSTLVKRKGRVTHVIFVGKTEVSYVVEDGIGNYSHGFTLKEAREGLIYKISSRDTTTFKGWNKQTRVKLSDAIKAYRAITGACEAGTKHFCGASGTLPETLTIADAIKRTSGQYGAEVFAQFFQN